VRRVIEEYLLYIKLKEAEALERSKILAVSALNSGNPLERHQKEVDMSFWIGETTAYAEMKMFLEGNSELRGQIKPFLETIVRNLIGSHNIAKIRELGAQDHQVGDTFENGVNAMKNKLLEILGYQEDIAILEF